MQRPVHFEILAEDPDQLVESKNPSVAMQLATWRASHACECSGYWHIRR
jgi:hypothetical protein